MMRYSHDLLRVYNKNVYGVKKNDEITRGGYSVNKKYLLRRDAFSKKMRRLIHE